MFTLLVKTNKISTMKHYLILLGVVLVGSLVGVAAKGMSDAKAAAAAPAAPATT